MARPCTTHPSSPGERTQNMADAKVHRAPRAASPQKAPASHLRAAAGPQLPAARRLAETVKTTHGSEGRA